eukprot:TRINITY_DN10745_c0_g1_i1.p1 TRINITY_DN10745_c0_g1~~TRINITY_DN10745_c0_g1_i1.p1  ORF type:complete len:343 (-),score=72.58 TRINITY_DN10745_c0_g1_i1:191-1219(-)
MGSWFPCAESLTFSALLLACFADAFELPEDEVALLQRSRDVQLGRRYFEQVCGALLLEHESDDEGTLQTLCLREAPKRACASVRQLLGGHPWQQQAVKEACRQLAGSWHPEEPSLLHVQSARADSRVAQTGLDSTLLKKGSGAVDQPLMPLPPYFKYWRFRGPGTEFCNKSYNIFDGTTSGRLECEAKCSHSESCRFYSFWSSDETHRCRTTTSCNSFSSDPLASISIYTRLNKSLVMFTNEDAEMKDESALEEALKSFGQLDGSEALKDVVNATVKGNAGSVTEDALDALDNVSSSERAPSSKENELPAVQGALDALRKMQGNDSDISVQPRIENNLTNTT